MHHFKNFNSISTQEELEKFFLDEALQYLRRRGFNVKLLRTENGFRPADFWFITEIDNFASFDKWPEMTLDEQKGQQMMNKLINIIDTPKATVLKELS